MDSRILVVEDTPANIQVLSSTLKDSPQILSRIEPLNLIESRASVVVRSVAALPFGAFRFRDCPPERLVLVVGTRIIWRRRGCGVPAGEACPSR